MAFSWHNFIKSGFLKAVGSQPDYWIILNSAGYAEKGVLTESDLADIQAAIDHKNQATATAALPESEEPVEAEEPAERQGDMGNPILETEGDFDNA